MEPGMCAPLWIAPPVKDLSWTVLYRTDGRLFSLNRFKAKSNVKHSTIMELQYVDDNAIAAHTSEDLQDILNAFAKACRALGLTLNIKKTQVLY
ncbi:hypothetical protein ABVT39_013196 [Epinephelus coioides]